MLVAISHGCGQKKQAKAPPKEVAPSPAPYRRRIPIEIVEGTEPATTIPEAPNGGTSSRAVRKGPLIEEIPDPTPASESNGPPKTFQQAKQKRETRGPRKVGGGILKRDGSHSDAIFAPKALVPEEVGTSSSGLAEEAQPVNGSGKSKQSHPKPTNAFEFQRQWQADPASTARWSILQASVYYSSSRSMSDLVRRPSLRNRYPPFLRIQWNLHCSHLYSRCYTTRPRKIEQPRSCWQHTFKI